LDPDFAMPHLHIGLASKRWGNVETARIELTRALVLLPGEDASRILFFGGGFTRDALIQACRAEIAAFEGGVAT
jgi:chemotaxis protein methyltransferase CheR